MKEIPLPTLEELSKNRPKLRNTHKEVLQKMNRLDRFAVWITRRIGTIGFFIIIFIWTILWLGWNLLAPRELQFDPPTGFVFWLFISNLIQILLMPLIMVGQNIEGRQAEARAEHDLEVNIKAEEEIGIIIRHLEYQQNLLLTLIQKIDGNTK
jgi:uncharacterized membrane protein